MQENKNIHKVDPVKKQEFITKADQGEGLSPMGSAEDFQPAEDIQFEYKDLHPFFQELYDEHEELKKININLKEAGLKISHEHTVTKETGKLIAHFLNFFHEEFVPHNKKEEAKFFPLLHERLLQAEEHSIGSNPFTGVKILEDDHLHAIRLGAILANLLYLSSVITEFKSQTIIANEMGKICNELSELLELHIFREDHIMMGLGQTLLSAEELDQIYAELKML